MEFVPKKKTMVEIEKEAIANLSTGSLNANASQLALAEEIDRVAAEAEMEACPPEPTYSGVSGRVMKAYTRNSQAKENSKIKEKILACAYANLGQYTPKEVSELTESNQPLLYMRITPTKIRAAQSLIKDILLSDDDIYSLVSKELPTLPAKVVQKIQEGVAELRELQDAGEEPGPDEAEVKGNKVTKAQATIIEELTEARAIEDALYQEIRRHTTHEVEKISRLVKQEMDDGDWDDSLDEFIDDYCIFPTAFMRGGIIQEKKILSWENGVPVTKNVRVYRNKRIHPLDIYPDPGSPTLQRGDLVEHARFTREDIEVMLRGEKSLMFKERLLSLLDKEPNSVPWFSDQSHEEDKAETEIRGNSHDASTGIYHALIFNGRVKASDLALDGIILKQGELSAEVKAVMVEGQLVSVKLNSDPLGRRNYFSASYHRTPGSVWGTGLPTLMEDIQRVCNSAARSLVVNMSFSAGPQSVVQVERLMDSGDIEDMTPLKIWQVRTPTTGQEGKAVDFFMVPSVAEHLIGIYDKFEAKADDATGIPRYSYGNSNVGGAGTTAKGLGLLLESASKNIKEAVRHIDRGLIIPRVELQFYWTLTRNPQLKYSGALNVIAHGSQTLAMKAALEEKRREFFQLTANEFDFKTIKQEGRAKMLKQIADDCKFDEEVVPNLLKVKFDIAKDNEMREREMQAKEKQAENGNASVQAAQVQASVTEKIAASNAEIKKADISLKAQKQDNELRVKAEELQLEREKTATKAMAEVQGKQVTADAMKDVTRTKVAADIAKGQAAQNT